MAELGGYTLEALLHSGRETHVYRARRPDDGKPVVLKVARAGRATLVQRARLQREYRLLQRIDSEHVIRPLALERVGDEDALVLEAVDATPLSEQVSAAAPMAISAFLRLALRLVAGLQAIHASGVVHRDLKPSNILYNPETRRAVIIDFSVSSQISSERAEGGEERLEGTLAYMAPEQTGRINRRVDYRSDYYSLGVTFYELLTGVRPFSADEPAELLHAHIARPPRPPEELRPDLPPQLGAIVLKLMAKSAEERYQSAGGLSADLERCLEAWAHDGAIEPFALGSADRSAVFRVPEGLVGRGAQLAQLHRSLAAAFDGEVKLALVAGAPGVGKSSLVREFLREISARRGHLGAGKFDLHRRGTPHVGLARALRQVLRQLLLGGESEVATWRERLRAALGPGAAALVPLLPELEQLLGETADAAAAAGGLREASNLLQIALSGLVDALAGPDHPLVLFLDDLQWCGEETFRLLEGLLSAERLGHLLVIGSYRDNEVEGEHPLWSHLERLRAAGRAISTVEVGPLSAADTAAIVAATLSPTALDCTALARLLYRRSGGNPFFLRIALRSLYERSLFAFDAAAGGWSWRFEEIADADTSDDVGLLLSLRIGELSPASRELVELAACIGNDFSIELLALSLDRDPLAIAEGLLEAVHKGLVRPLGNAYKYLPEGLAIADDEGRGLLRAARYCFEHDRIQQAAYGRIPGPARPRVHLKAGRLLAARVDDAALDDDGELLFSLTGHLNHAVDLLDDGDERLQLARYNLSAGRRARGASAWELAAHHLSQALALLPDDSWRRYHRLTFAIYGALMEVEQMRSNTAAARELLRVAQAHARGELEEVELLATQWRIDASLHDYAAMLETSRAALGHLGYRIPATATTPRLLREFAAVNLQLGRLDTDALAAAEAPGPADELAMRFLVRMWQSALQSDPRLGTLTLLRLARAAFRLQRSDYAALGLAGLAMFTIYAFGVGKHARRYGELALALVDRGGDLWVCETAAAFVSVLVTPWSESVRASAERLEQVYERMYGIGHLDGAYIWASYTSIFRWAQGQGLAALAEFVDRVRPGAVRYFGERSATIAPMTLMARYTAHLRAPAEGPQAPVRAWIEPELRDALAASNNSLALELCALFEAQLAFIGGDLEAAERALAEAAGYQTPLLKNSVFTAHRRLFDALLIDRRAAAADAATRRTFKAELKEIRRYLRRFVAANERDFAALQAIVDGITARLDGDPGQAQRCFERAVEAAHAAGSLLVEALAFEIAARSALAAGTERIGSLYLRDACRLFIRWGAERKVRALAEEFPVYLARDRPTQASIHEASTPSSSRSLSESIDLAALLRASNVISSELILERLLRQALTIILENAGAQRGVLLLRGDGDAPMRIEADSDLVRDTVEILGSTPPTGRVCLTIVLFVERTGEDIILDDALADGEFVDDPYIRERGIRSVLCTPVSHKGLILGILYLEHREAPGVFTLPRVALLKHLASQVAISVENARLYRRLDSALDRALAADKAKARFLLTMSHELRTPLNAVLGYTDLIAESIEDGDLDSADEDLERIREGATRLVRTLTSVLELSRLETGDAAPTLGEVDVRALLTEVVGECREALADGVALELVGADALPPTLVTDAFMLRYALFSVLDNACRFTAHGRVTCRVDVDVGWLRVVVEDTGVGIPEAAQERIFEAFRQADDSTTRAFEGSGVSLAVVRGFCELLGGSIAVISELGVGSTFFIRVPTGADA